MRNNFSKYFILFTFTFLVTTFSYAQKKSETDSLRIAIAKANDTTKIIIYLKLADRYAETDPNLALKYYNSALTEAKKCGKGKWIVKTHLRLFTVLKNQGSAKRAYNILDSTVLYLDTVNANSDYGSYFIQRGNISFGEGNYNNAALYYLRALKVFDEINDDVGRARAYHGLGYAHDGMEDFDRAIGYYKKADSLYTKMKMFARVSGINANMAGIYVHKFEHSKSDHDFKIAFDYLSAAVNSSILAKDVELTGNNYNNLATLYAFAENYNEAIKYNEKALEIREQNNLLPGMASSTQNLARCYLLLKDLKKAEEYASRALVIAKEIQSTSYEYGAYELMSGIDEEKGDQKQAFYYYKKFIRMRDSIQNFERSKKQAELEEKYSSEKKDKAIELLNQTQEAKDAELAKQKVVNYSIGGGLALVVIFSFFVLRANRERKKANEKLHLQNDVIEEKNRHITDSINYAKTIQSAIIPDKEEFANHFSDSFVCYMPKDIVSGDFYWIASSGDKVFFAAVDCTGHGVPGGFMCMLGSSLLSEIVNERNVTSPSRVLEQLREKIMGSLRQTGQSGESKDGMDLVFCCLDKKTLKLSYSSAYNSFYLIRKNELIESEVNKMPVGYHHKMGPFKEFEMQLEKGDTLYLFTDGYADQFGGQAKKKFKYSRLKELLLSVNEKVMSEQKDIVEKTILDWRGELEQVDDICLIGIKI